MASPHTAYASRPDGRKISTILRRALKWVIWPGWRRLLRLGDLSPVLSRRITGWCRASLTQRNSQSMLMAIDDAIDHGQRSWPSFKQPSDNKCIIQEIYSTTINFYSSGQASMHALAVPRTSYSWGGGVLESRDTWLSHTAARDLAVCSLDRCRHPPQLPSQ
ncbi:hypothetical protein O181_043904 [Austropuccinia psidii MF-1]|uniref:Uncharacterized protein n=1 Tax=Austropuccinia psidii MF-1 TaxID=1389203 RepID=A0A9Q3HIW7_9BASI|nr:hypothetical protein [Austropuccinia psidii MF-1]